MNPVIFKEINDTLDHVLLVVEQLKQQLAETREEAENWRNNITPATEERGLFSWEITQYPPACGR